MDTITCFTGESQKQKERLELKQLLFLRVYLSGKIELEAPYICYSSLGNVFIVEQNILLVLYFLQIYIRSQWGKKYILPNLTNRNRSRSRLKKIPGAGAAKKNTRSWSHLVKKFRAGAGAAWKKIRSRKSKKNYPAPQPWIMKYYLSEVGMVDMC